MLLRCVISAAVAGRFRVVEGAGVGRDGDGEGMAAGAADADQTLSERLMLSKTEDFDPIPAPILRKYVSYARKYVHPKLNPAAGKVVPRLGLDFNRSHRIATPNLPPPKKTPAVYFIFFLLPCPPS